MIPDWDNIDWRTWHEYAHPDKGGYRWYDHLTFSQHPQASPLTQQAQQGRVLATHIKNINLPSMSRAWAKDILDRGFGSAKLRECAQRVIDDYNAHDSNLQDLIAGYKEGKQVLIREAGVEDFPSPPNLDLNTLEELDALVAARGGEPEPFEERNLAEQFNAITRELYFLGRGRLPQHVPMEYILGLEHHPFLAELSMLEKYYAPTPATIEEYFRGRMRDSDRAAYKKELSTWFKGEDGFGALMLLLRDINPHLLNSYSLRLLWEPSRNLAYALHDLYLWLAYGQQDAPSWARDTFESILRWEGRENADLSTPSGRGRLWGLFGDEPAILQATDIGAWE